MADRGPGGAPAGRRSRNLVLSDAAVEGLDRLAELWSLYSDTGRAVGRPNRSAAAERAIEEALGREEAEDDEDDAP